MTHSQEMTQYHLSQEKVLFYSQKLTQMGYLVGVGGNVSMRVEGEEALAITPSGRDYMSLTAADICICSFDKKVLAGELAPSVELGMHAAVYYQRPDVNAVVHTHQPFASTFSLIDAPIPQITDEQVYHLGDQIAVVPYAISGSDDLARQVSLTVGNQCNAFILQNHGILCTGITLLQATNNAQILEKVTQIYYYALASGLPVTTLPKESVETLFAVLKTKQQAQIEGRSVDIGSI